MVLHVNVIMPEIRVDCNSTVINGTVQFIINFSPSLRETNSTNTQDSLGAMRFTIAVVLVYGIGVIGLLGISARRNRRMDVMDKEVNKFIKTKLSKYEERKVRKQKRTINKLISSLHSIIQTDETAVNKSRNQIKFQHKGPLSRANTWSGNSHNPRLKLAGNTGTMNMAVNTVTFVPLTDTFNNCTLLPTPLSVSTNQRCHPTQDSFTSLSTNQRCHPTQDSFTPSAKFKTKKVTFSETCTNENLSIGLPVSPV